MTGSLETRFILQSSARELAGSLSSRPLRVLAVSWSHGLTVVPECWVVLQMPLWAQQRWGQDEACHARAEGLAVRTDGVASATAWRTLPLVPVDLGLLREGDAGRPFRPSRPHPVLHSGNHT